MPKHPTVVGHYEKQIPTNISDKSKKLGYGVVQHSTANMVEVNKAANNCISRTDQQNVTDYNNLCKKTSSLSMFVRPTMTHIKQPKYF